MNPNQLKQILEAIINEFDAKISKLNNDVSMIKDNIPNMDVILDHIKGKDGHTPVYGVDWNLSSEEIKSIIEAVKPVEGVDYTIPKDGKDAVITNELIDRIVSTVQSKVKDGKNGKDGIDGIDGLDGSPDTPKQVKDKLESLKDGERLDSSAIKGLENYTTQADIDRAISILDQRTQYLINKVANSSGGSGGAFSGITGTPNEIAYFDSLGNGTSDSLATRDSTTNETNIGMPVFAEGNVTDGISQQVTWRADNVGSIGNSITLVFNGVDDTDTVLAAWNLANPSNTASVIDGTGNFVPASGTVIFSGGGTVSFQESRNIFGQPFQGAGFGYNSGGAIVGFNGLLNTNAAMQPFIISADFVTGDIALGQWQPDRIQIQAQRGSNGDTALLKIDPYAEVTLGFNGSVHGQSGVTAFDGGLNFRNFNYTWVWPGSDGSAGQSLITDGVGNLSWGAGGLVGYTDTSNTALGLNTGITGLGTKNTFIGVKAGGSLSTGNENTFIGWQAAGAGSAVAMNNAIVIGTQNLGYAWGGADDFIAIGKDTLSAVGVGAGSVVIGTGASSASADGVAIGYGANSGNTGSIAIGSGASSIGHSNSIAIGRQAINTTNNQFVVGSNAYIISDFYFGSGVRNGLLPNTVNMYATGGVGTDAAGGQFLFYGGQSTGTGVGGDIRFYVAPAVGMSGTSDNPYHNFLSLGADKISKFGDIDDVYYGLRLDIDNNAGSINLGNQGGAGGNGTRIGISDSSETITFYTGYNAVPNSRNFVSTYETGGGNAYTKIGDIDGSGNKTLLTVNEGTNIISVDSTKGSTVIGDALGVNNGTKATINDSAKTFTFSVGATDRFIAYQDWTLIGNAFVTSNWQTYTGSGNVTMNNNVSGLVYNPASTNATATINLPTTSGGTGSNITIVFGGTITSGAVVTSLTIAPGSGNTIIDSSAPTTANAGESFSYHKEGSVWYRVNK